MKILPDDLTLPVLDMDGALEVFSEGHLEVWRLSWTDWARWALVLSAREGAAVVWVLSTEALGRIRLLQSSKPLEAWSNSDRPKTTEKLPL